MSKFAEYHFHLGGVQSDGATTEEHLRKAKANCFAPQVINERTFEESPEEVKCPHELAYVWNWYFELDETRTVGMDVNPILYSEIKSWAWLRKVDLTDLEIKAIKAIDKVYLRHCRDSRKKDKDG